MMTQQTQAGGRDGSGARQGGDPQAAREYCGSRFGGSRRMARLDRLEQSFARQLMALAGPEASVLDAPCGSGRFYPILSKAGRLTMLDLDPAMLDEVRRAHGQASSLQLVRGDASALPFPDGSFDLVLCMRLLHHIGDDALRLKILRELARVTRRYVGLSFYTSLSWRYLRRAARGKSASGHAIATGRFIAQARQAGLRLVRKVPRFSFWEQQRLLLLEKT